MAKKLGTVSAKLCSLQRIFIVQDTKYKQKSKVQELPLWDRKVLDIICPEYNQVKFCWPIAREVGNTKGA